MTKKEPLSKKAYARLKREQKAESERTKVIQILMSDNGKPDERRKSLREVGEEIGRSHTWVADIAKLCLNKRTYNGNGKKYTRYWRKSGYRRLLKPGKRGPAPGRYSQKRKDATADILAMKE